MKKSFIISFFVFIVIITIASVASSRSDTMTSDNSFPMNSDGQTYGSLGGINTIEEAPDLIEAQGVDGTFGYVLKTDLLGGKLKSPEDDISSIEGNVQLPLYDLDGKTVIGTFEISKAREVKYSKENMSAEEYNKMLNGIETHRPEL